MPLHPRALLSAVPIALLTVAVALPAAPASADAGRTAVPASRPAWTADATDLGAASSDDLVEVQIALDLPDEQGAEDFATAVSTPGTAQYGRPLSPADWIARFAPTQQQVDDLIGQLQTAGFTVTDVPASRLFVLATADAGAVDSYFRTRIHAYDVDGVHRVAAATAVSLPTRAARHVAAVLFDHSVATTRMATPQAKASSTPCSAYWAQHTVSTPKAYGAKKASTPLCGYTAKQLRALSGITGANAGDGRGQTVAVLDAFGSSTIRADLATYSKRNSLPAASYSELVDRSAWTTSASCTPSGWATEQTMDLEAVHAIAPRAKLLYVGADDCGFGLDTAMSRILDRGLATIVSNSWGSTAGDTAAGLGYADDQTLLEMTVNLHQHVQAAGEGIGLYFASGDNGDDAALVGQKAVDFPASSPWVTAVGGTATALDKRNRVVFSAPWGETEAVAKRGRWLTTTPGVFVQGAGGGASSLFERPAYQSLVGGTVIAHGMRASADVSADAAQLTGMLVGQRVHGTYRTQQVGGTSLATPIVAAQAAIAQQRAGRALGFLNPALYRIASQGKVRDVVASKTHRAVAFTTSGRTVLITLDRDSSLAARRGYDYPTGVGELTPASLRALAGLRS